MFRLLSPLDKQLCDTEKHSSKLLRTPDVLQLCHA